MFRALFTALSFLILAGVASAQPAPKLDDKKLVTRVYDLKPILGDKGKASGFADTDAIIKLILETISPVELKAGTDGPQLIERDGGKLEVRAPAKMQEEVGDLIEAIVRLVDLAIDVKAKVVELDPAAFENLLKTLPKPMKGKPDSPILFATGEEMEEKAPTPEELKVAAEMNRILKAGRVVQTSTARFTNGIEATFSARQSVLTYYQNQAGQKKPSGPPQFVKDGFKLVGLPVISVDRRFVRMKLTEQATAVNGIKTRILAEIDGQNIVSSAPDLEDLGATGSATIADGGTVLFRLTYAPKDKVWVVVLHPTIFIQAEEDVLKKEKEAKK